MNPTEPATPRRSRTVSTDNDTTKLVSLLALAAGAAAMPQSSRADIIYHPSSTTVGYGSGGEESFLFDLPGTALVGFQRWSRVTSSTFLGVTTSYRTVFVGSLYGGVPGGVRGDASGFAVPLPFGATWSQGGVATFYSAAVATAHFGTLAAGQNPASGFDNQYLAWTFFDSTQGSAPRYGWVEISLDARSYPAGGPMVTIWGYAYDDTGAKPTMGAVPEPSSGALLAMGALALGARGLRKWRQTRSTPADS